MTVLVENWNYLVVICLMMGGLFIVISQNNLVKKLVGLAIFQTSVFLFYISVGKIAGGTAPRPAHAGLFGDGTLARSRASGTARSWS